MLQTGLIGRILATVRTTNNVQDNLNNDDVEMSYKLKLYINDTISEQKQMWQLCQCNTQDLYMITLNNAPTS